MLSYECSEWVQPIAASKLRKDESSDCLMAITTNPHDESGEE